MIVQVPMPPLRRYRTFDIEIEQRGDRYWVQVLDSPAGQSEAPFDLPFSDEEVRALAAGTVQHVSAQLSPQEAGARLFEALFHAGVRECLRASLAQTGADGLRINLRLHKAPSLASLPWELLYDPVHKRFLALSEHTPITRYLALPLAEPPLAVTPPLHVLALLAHPVDAGPPLQVELEWKNLQQALADLQRQGRVVLARLDTVTWPALQNYLREHTVHVLHFIGHGLFDADAGESGLLLENNQQQGVFVPATRFAMLLHNHHSLRLVLLNACESATASTAELFTGVAQRLVQQGIPAVIAMQEEISDAAALAFGREFYAALADDYPVDAALTQARVAICATDSDEWATPVLFMRTPDGQLFARAEVEATQTTKSPIRWHRVGTAWLGAGLLGMVLLGGVIHLLIQDNTLLQGTIVAMAALLVSLLGILGLQGDKTYFPRLSQFVGRTRLAQAGLGALLALSLGLWGVVGLPRLQANGCDPLLGCKVAGEQWFGVAEWTPLVENLSPAEQHLIKSMRRILYTKLSQVETLKGINIDSPQANASVKQRLDIWIEGDYQRFDTARLSAYINRAGGQVGEVASIPVPPEIIDNTGNVCILDLQNQLVFDILDKLQISLSQETMETISNLPTRSCEALQLAAAAEALSSTAVDIAIRDTNFRRAKVLLQRALNVDPNYAEAQNNLGFVLYSEGNYNAAIAQYQRAIELQPEFPVYPYNLGLAYEQQGNLAAAVEAYRRAIDLDPGYAKAYNNLGFTYLLLDDLEQAQEAIQIGLQIDPNLPALHKNLGRIYLNQGEATAAVSALNQAVALLPSFAEAHFYLALAYQAQDRTEAACAALFEYFLILIDGEDTPEREARADSLVAEWQCDE